MSGPTRIPWHSRVLFAGLAGMAATCAVAAFPSPAQAFWIGFPFPFGGYYPPPSYGYYPPPPPYYAPPAAYYPPPAYPADPAYAAPAQPAPSAYGQQPTSTTYSQPTQPSGYTQEPLAPLTQPSAAATPGQTAQITYTNKPAFRNASGQTCREFTTNDASGKANYGTACQATDGQWRVTD